jgi:hypothetical protein
MKINPEKSFRDPRWSACGYQGGTIIFPSWFAKESVPFKCENPANHQFVSRAGVPQGDLLVMHDLRLQGPVLSPHIDHG